MFELFDKRYSHRISEALKEKVRTDIDGPGFIARGILEAIRLLEGENVAQSTRAMRHKERELKGELEGFFHIHVAEDNFSRLMNNFGGKPSKPIKNPRPDELIAYATNQVLKAYVKKFSIPYSSDDTQHLRDAIINSSHAKKIGADNIFDSIQKQIPMMIDKVFFSNNKVSGDWLLYKKHSDGKNYYLDFTVHVESEDTQRQIELRASLNKSFQELIKQH